MLGSSLRTLAIALILTTALAWHRGGSSLVLRGLENSLSIASTALPLIVIAFIVIGLLQLLVSQDSIRGLFGKHPGFRGIVLTSLAGSLLPGGPYVFYPLVSSSVMRQGVSAPVLFSFVAAKHAWDIPRIPLEMSLVGPELTLWRLLLTLPYPLVTAYAIGALESRTGPQQHAPRGESQ